MSACVLCDIVEQLLLDNGLAPDIKARSAVTLAFVHGVAAGIDGKDVEPPVCLLCLSITDGAIRDALADRTKVPE
jgi:hypothetical protein